MGRAPWTYSSSRRTVPFMRAAVTAQMESRARRPPVRVTHLRERFEEVGSRFRGLFGAAISDDELAPCSLRAALFEFEGDLASCGVYSAALEEQMVDDAGERFGVDARAHLGGVDRWRTSGRRSGSTRAAAS